MKIRLGLCAAIFLLGAIRAGAEGPPDPGIGYVFPAGGRAGTTVEVKLGIYEWTPDLHYFVHSDKLRLEVTGPPGPLLIQERPHALGKRAYNPPPLPREVPARLVVAADVPPGPIRWQVANANGSSGTALFFVSHGREAIENEDRTSPQTLGPLPVTVSGRVRRNEEIDRYVVRRPAAGPISCELWARRLGSPFHGCLEVRDDAGKIVADVVDTQGYDTACTFVADGARDYTVSVRDLDALGNRAFVYRLAVWDGPRVVAAIPQSDRQSGVVPFEFVGFGLKTGKADLERVRRDVPVGDHVAGTTAVYRLETPFGRSQPVTVDLAASEQSAGAGPHRPPFHVVGEFGAGTDQRVFLFTAKKADRFKISATSRVTGAPVDLSLAVLGADGKEIARNDDLPGTCDAGLELACNADGQYRAIVSDLSAHEGLPHVYRFSIDRAVPDFQLEVPQRVPVTLEEKGELTVKVSRTGGFAGPVRLSLRGLPEGVHVSAASALVIPANQAEVSIPLGSTKNAPVVASLAKIFGTATIEGHPVMHAAFALTENLSPAPPDEKQISQILIASVMKPRVRIWPVESDERTVNRGTFHLAILGIERLEGFRGDVLLQLESRQPNKFRQGILGPDILVPPDQTRVLYPCFVGEECETVDAYRVSVNAYAKVKDPKGREHWLVSCMRSTVSVAMTVEGGLLKISADQPVLDARPGSTVHIPVHVLRSPRLPGPVTLHVGVPPALQHVMKAATVTVPPGVETASIPLHLGEKARVAEHHELTVKGTTTLPADLPRLVEGLRATPMPAEYCKLLSAGFLPAVSEAKLELEIVPGEKTK